MAGACKGCLGCLLKFFNFLLTLLGLSMIGYGIYLFIQWKKITDQDDQGGGDISPASSDFVQLGRPMLLLVSLSDNILDKLPKAWDALKILQDTQRLAVSTLSSEKKEELRSLEAQIAFSISDPTYAFEDARSTLNQHPNSIAVWNYYYKVILRSEMNSSSSKSSKFLSKYLQLTGSENFIVAMKGLDFIEK